MKGEAAEGGAEAAPERSPRSDTSVAKIGLQTSGIRNHASQNLHFNFNRETRDKLVRIMSTRHDRETVGTKLELPLYRKYVTDAAKQKLS